MAEKLNKLSKTELSVLLIMHMKATTDVKSIARMLEMDKSDVNKALNALIEKKYLTRTWISTKYEYQINNNIIKDGHIGY